MANGNSNEEEKSREFRPRIKPEQEERKPTQIDKLKTYVASKVKSKRESIRTEHEQKEAQKREETRAYKEEYSKERILAQRAKARKAAHTDTSLIGRLGRIGARVGTVVVGTPTKTIHRGRKVRLRKPKRRRVVLVPQRRAAQPPPRKKIVPLWEQSSTIPDFMGSPTKKKKKVPIWMR